MYLQEAEAWSWRSRQPRHRLPATEEGDRSARAEGTPKRRTRARESQAKTASFSSCTQYSFRNPSSSLHAGAVWLATLWSIQLESLKHEVRKKAGQRLIFMRVLEFSQLSN